MDEFFRKFESLLKLAGSSLLVAALFGFPAVYLHFLRFNILKNFMSYSQVRRAGALPTICFVLAWVCIYWVKKKFPLWESIEDLFLKPQPIALLVLLFAIPIVFAGVVSTMILSVWLLVNRDIIVPIISLVFAYSKSSIVPALVCFICSVMVGLFYIIPRERRIRRDPSKPDKWFMMWLYLSELGFVIVWSLYAIRGALYLEYPQLASILSNSIIILITTATVLIVTGAVMQDLFLEWIKGAISSREKRSVIVVVLIVMVPYAIFVSVYSYIVYPELPHGIGGGKPALVSLWVEKKVMPASLQRKLNRAVFSADGDMLKCEGLYLFDNDADRYILIDSISPPVSAIVVSKDQIKAISW